jgi:small subunit ribosomal protein S4
MGRYIGPNCRICRAQKQKLMLKGDRCVSSKCPIDKKTSLLRKGLPGRSSTVRMKKVSNYGLQLKEKQKMRSMYGLFEKQFRRYFFIARRKKGVTGDNLLILLETRLDNVLYRLHFASSIKQARQIVLHGHVKINDKVINIPSYNVKKDEVVTLIDKSKRNKIILDSLKRVKTDGIPIWLEINEDEVRGTIKQLPRRNEMDYIGNINEQLVVELYSK